MNLTEMWPTTVEMDSCGSNRDAAISSGDVEFLNTYNILNYESDSASCSYVNEADRWALFMYLLLM